MRGLINIERKWYELIGCYTYYVALSYDLVIQGEILKMLNLRNGRAHWHGTKGKWLDSMLWLQTLTSPMTLTLDFQGKIFKLLYLRNGRVDLLGMKGMWFGVQNRQKFKRYTRKILFMNDDTKCVTIELWTRYSLTNFENHFGLHVSVVFLDPNMCGFLHICILFWSQTLVVNWQN